MQLETPNDSPMNQREDPIFFCGAELHESKLEKITRLIRSNGLDALLFLKSEAVRYVTDFYAKGYRRFMDVEYFVLVTKDGRRVIGYSSGSDTYRIKLRCWVDDTRKIQRGFVETIKGTLVDYGLTNARIGTDLLPHNVYLGLKKSLPAVEFVDASEIWTELTVVKHPDEIKLLRKSLDITSLGLETAIKSAGAGVREIEVAARAEAAMREAGSEMEPMITQIASGVNAAIFERVATDKIIRDGELVIIDLGSVYNGYTGDAGRTTMVGNPTQKQKEIYGITYRALMESIKKAKPGVECAEIDAKAKQVLQEAGYEKYGSKFALGHQLGYGLHGEPLVTKGERYVLKPNMVMALEPRINMFDQVEVGGIHIEDAILITETGAEVLTHAPYENNLLR